MNADRAPLSTHDLEHVVWGSESPAAPSAYLPPSPTIEGPIRLRRSGWRTESDSMGPVLVPADHHWGPQTQRSLSHFDIGTARVPNGVYRAYGHIKRATCIANREAGALPGWKAGAILRVCEEIIAGALDDEFPVRVFQTGSGTHSHANVNEVIANRANHLLGYAPGTNYPIHPSDDVNASQSTNDTFVTAMHVAAYHAVTTRTIPELRSLAEALDNKARAWSEVPKVGRTHLMDAVPLSVGEEWSGYAAAMAAAAVDVTQASQSLLEVALGGTAVGTGLNAPDGFRERSVALLAESTGHPFRAAANAFAAQATLDPMVRAHAALTSAAVSLFKIANDLRWLSSGPRMGLQELRIPTNEPGSTMMPGKTNPTQAEATLMVCVRVMGNNTVTSMAGAEGNFELNAFRPIVISAFMESAMLMADACRSLSWNLIVGTELNRRQLALNLERSVLGITALTPVIGYQRAADIAHHAIENDLPVRDAAIALGLSAQEYDRLIAEAHEGTHAPQDRGPDS